jgi:hypothetical protein
MERMGKLRGVVRVVLIVAGIAGTLAALPAGSPAVMGSLAPTFAAGPTRLDRELELIEPEARERWPESFAGVWGSAGVTPNRIYVAFTSDAAGKVARLAERFSRPEMLVPVTVRYSLVHLEHLELAMRGDREAARGRRNPMEGLRGAQYDLSINVKANAVEMIVPAQLALARRSVTKAYGKPDDPSADGIRVMKGSLDRQEACADQFHCGLQLRAGIGTVLRRFPTNVGSYCTDAFVVRTIGGATQILSAAHCGDDLPQGDQGNRRYHREDPFEAHFYDANLYGSVQYQVHEGRVDAERHSIGNGFSGHPWVYLRADAQASPIWSIGTWASVMVDQTYLCKSGVTTGYSCGYVRDKYLMPEIIPGGNRFMGILLTGSSSGPGDSGAPFVQYGTQAEGILHGGRYGACSCLTAAGHIEYADEALGVIPIREATPGPPDVIGVSLYGNQSGRTEVHTLEGATNYAGFDVHAATALEAVRPEQWWFQAEDYNRDGLPDVFAIRGSQTQSGMTEVHVLDGATNYTTYLLHAVTALPPVRHEIVDFALRDYNGDGRTDLFAIAENNTGSGRTEVHVYDGATAYSTALLHIASALEAVNGEQWWFRVANYNGDGRPDLFAIRGRQTQSGVTEVHVLDAATNYSSYLLHAVSALGPAGHEKVEFGVRDYNRDGRPDVFAMVLNRTGTTTTEIHVLDAATSYSTYLLHAPSALPEQSPERWQFMPGL